MSGMICSVRGCFNNWGKRKLSLSQQCFEHGTKRSECCGPAYNLYPPPSNKEDRERWVRALNLKRPPKRPYVCSFHFVEKKPTALHPYPEKWLGYNAPMRKPRLVKVRDASKTRAVEKNAAHCREEPMSEPLPEQDHNYASSLQCHQPTQCSGPTELHVKLLRSDQLSLLHTGLPLATFHFLADYLTKDHATDCQLDVRDQVLMTLMKLRLNLLRADLAERFRVSPSEVGAIVSSWLDIAEGRTRRFILWLPRETILATTPRCFKDRYPSATCVIGFSETPLQRAHSLDSTEKPRSHFYEQNTIKYLVAAAPCGLIMFVSPAYRGGCSERFIASDSGFLDHLRPGDIVMAETHLSISDLLRGRQVKLVIPASAKTEAPSEGDGGVRAHVEAVSCRLTTFRILSQAIPVDMEQKCDQILRICAALANLRGDVSHKAETED